MMLDRATSYAMTQRIWASAAGFATAALVGTFFSLELQGYYYTFLSLLTLQTFVELGFGQALQQCVSHEWAAFNHGSDAERLVAGSRLASLFRLAMRWYVVAAALVALGLGTAGTVYFGRYGDVSLPDWRMIWWLSCLAAAGAVLLTPLLAVLEGTNRVGTTYGVQLGQGIVSRLTGMASIVLGGGLWTVPLARAASLLTGASALGYGSREALYDLWRREGAPVFSWRAELWPLQWKIALSWVGGYLLFSLFTPVLFAFQGAAAAGRMGMTLSMGSALASMAFAMVTTRVPALAIAVARRRYQELDMLFLRAVGGSMALVLTGSALLLLVLVTLQRASIPIAERFLAPIPTAMLLAALVLHQLRFALASYLRAHKQEPYMALSLAEALLAIAILVPLGKHYAAEGMAAGFLALAAAALIPALVIFFRCRHAWHLATPGDAMPEGHWSRG